MKKIILNNFKSYFGSHTIGPFNEKFSAIVGANGSGKSNLIDAMLFVFGKRANWMRLKKLKELIHRSQEHPDCAEAFVQVEFCYVIDGEEEEVESK